MININFLSEIIVFQLCCIFRAVLLFNLAKKWPLVMETWQKKEEIFLSHPYTTGKWSLKLKVRITAFIFFIFCLGKQKFHFHLQRHTTYKKYNVLVEHSLYLATAMHDNQIQLDFCKTQYQRFFENLLKRERPQVLYILPFAYWQLPFYEWTNLALAFVWTFVDLWIAICSIGLTTRLNQLNERIKITLKLATPPKPELWREFRIHYVFLCDLVQFVDSHISFLILISTGHNVFSFCVMLFNSFKWVVNNIFTTYS